ncbi:phospholipase A2 inhibitor NAI-like [Mixophyes fleayi]|uniref:phospholipase A2 inhibitor NAI-like n=1 Tax=Mixophyes fleayi TaxID=3061075 RepID=UPI003F4E410C
MKMSKLLTLLLFCVVLATGLSLQCKQCAGLPYNCTESPQLCYINQTSCMSQSFTIVENGLVTEKTYKGCSQGLVCNETVYVDLGYKKTYISSQCCNTDNCNTGTYYNRVPVAALFCQTCQGNSGSCATSNLTSIQCAGVQDRCMTATTMYVNVSSSDVVIKGCGTGNLCGRRLEYNTGKGRVYTEVSCCGRTNCNQGLKTVTVNETTNDMSCYACNETGKGECTKPTTVRCTGNMTTCLDIQGFPRGNTLMRGCCSKDVCLGLSASLLIQASQKLYCCTGNLCNTGSVASYFNAGSTPAASGVLISVTTLLVLMKELLTLL